MQVFFEVESLNHFLSNDWLIDAHDNIGGGYSKEQRISIFNQGSRIKDFSQQCISNTNQTTVVNT